MTVPLLSKTETIDEGSLYIPDSPPLNSIRNGRDTVLDHEEDAVSLLARTTAPYQACSRVINRTAVLAFLDGTNPFHHLVMVFRRVFAALATFQVTDCVFVAWRGADPDSYYVKYKQHLSPSTNMTEFDGGIVSSLCRGGMTVLSARSDPTCFAKLLVGAAPGGWDMSLDAYQGTVAVNFAGVSLARLVAESVLPRAAAAAVPRPGGVLLVVRRGRRELVNEGDVRDAVVGGVAPAVVDVVDFERVDFRTALGLVSRRLVMVGVHSAGLTNLIFLPPSAGVVELVIARLKQEYRLLAASFGKRYHAHPYLVPTDEHVQDPRNRRVTADRLPDLARLCAEALSAAEHRAAGPSCC